MSLVSCEKIAQALHNFLQKKKWTLSFAESCTGGLLSSLITNNSGASDYFLGSCICYSNQSKSDLLKLSPIFLEQYGAVSQWCAEEMAISVQKVFHSDIACSITGNLGPNPSLSPPLLGTVWAAVAFDGVVHSFDLSGPVKDSRAEQKERFATHFLEKIYTIIRNEQCQIMN